MTEIGFTHQQKLTGHLFALFTTLVWGSCFVLTKVMLQAFTPIQIIPLRMGLAYLALWALRPKTMKLPWRDELMFILIGITGGSGSGSVTKLVNNMVAGAYMVVIAEAYAFAAKAGIDLQTTFEATRGGFAGGPVYENKVPKLIKRDFEPGARVAVHRKDILNAKHFAHHMGVDTPMTDVVLRVMDWMNDNGHIDEDQIAMVKYYEDKMDVTVGEEK